MDLVHPSARLVDAVTGATLGGTGLIARIDAAASEYASHPRGVVLALVPTQLVAITAYLGALYAGRPVALLDPGLPGTVLRELTERYQPVLVAGGPAGAPPEGYEPVGLPALGPAWLRRTAPETVPHPDLGLLLTTSGSTGSPKLVRLSTVAVLANAESIAQALGIDGDEVALTTLPLYYSYGMSVLHSHLRRGATVVLERAGILTRQFWRAVTEHGATSMAFVPYQYEILRRLRFDPGRYPALRTLTQAGGRLRPELVTDFHARMAAVGGRLFIMYGQTEAGPRITTLPAQRLPEKVGSSGPAIPGGRLLIRTEAGGLVDTAGVTGEVVYRGRNVMMGYAETAVDLARGDELGGELRTGDLGYLDCDGYLFLTGRLSRLGKVFGIRVNLDEVERMLVWHNPAAAVAGDDRIVIFAEGAGEDDRQKIRSALAEGLGTHSSGIEVRSIAALPLYPSGKINYRALEGA